MKVENPETDKKTDEQHPVVQSLDPVGENSLAVVKSPEGLSVLVDGYGFRLSKKSERLVVKKSDGSKVWEFALGEVSDIFVSANGSSISTDLIAEAAERGVAVHILERSGRPVAQMQSPTLAAAVETRRAQILAQTSQRGNALAAAFAAGKVLNQSRLLRYFSKYLSSARPGLAREVQKAALELLKIHRQILLPRESDGRNPRAFWMGLEGNAAHLYWEAVGKIISEKAEFPGRRHRGAADPVNCMLNYGYGILYAQVWAAILRAGLEPFAGFLHTDRPGKPSLVLDLTEEFRAPVVDRVVIAAVNLGQTAVLKDGLLTQDSRADLADKIFRRLESRETMAGKSYQIRSIIQMQARQIASYLREQTPRYRPFRFKW